RDAVRFIDRRKPRRFARMHEVARELGLPVDHHALAAGQPGQIDAMAHAAEQQLDPAVHEPFLVHALAYAGLVEEIDGHLLEDARGYSSQHVIPGLPLEDHRVDARFVQELAEQQSRWARTDDRNLCTRMSHGDLPLVVRPASRTIATGPLTITLSFAPLQRRC